MNLLELILLIFPAYVSNSIPVVLGGGKKIDPPGKTIFGESKTIRGFIAGVVFGTLAGISLAILLGTYYLPEASIETKIALSFLIALGAMLGDLAGSFIKRLRGLPSGYPSASLDQLPFIIIALALAGAYYPRLWELLWWQGFAIILAVTYVLHLIFNFVAHSLHLKKVPW